MGFTRYFSGNINITPELVKDVNTIIAESGVEIAGWDGTGLPSINTNEIRFNGAEDNSCETFLIENGDQYNFCKTNREPYDIVVATILKRIDATVQDFQYDSDGGNNEDAVTSLYNKVFGK